MKTGPLNEKELEWLEDVLMKYGTEASIMDVSELDGLLTAVLSSPVPIEPSQWLVALWGGSVLALTVVGGLFRVLMTAAGFKS